MPLANRGRQSCGADLEQLIEQAVRVVPMFFFPVAGQMVTVVDMNATIVSFPPNVALGNAFDNALQIDNRVIHDASAT